MASQQFLSNVEFNNMTVPIDENTTQALGDLQVSQQDKMINMKIELGNPNASIVSGVSQTFKSSIKSQT